MSPPTPPGWQAVIVFTALLPAEQQLPAVERGFTYADTMAATVTADFPNTDAADWDVLASAMLVLRTFLEVGR